MTRMFKKGDEKGFTLVELLVVIAIVAILAVVVLVALNPLEIIKKSRNSRRLQDLQAVRKALDIALAEATPPAGSTAFTAGATGSSCTGTQASDGTGWVVFPSASNISLSKYMAALPKDPQHPSACYVFTAAGDGTNYELNATLENVGDAANQMQNDGGNNNAKYEIGTDLTATN